MVIDDHDLIWLIDRLDEPLRLSGKHVIEYTVFDEHIWMVKMNFGIIFIVVVILLIIILTLLIIILIGEVMEENSSHKSGLITFTAYTSTLVIGGIIVLYTYINRNSDSDDESDDDHSYGIDFIEDILL